MDEYYQAVRALPAWLASLLAQLPVQTAVRIQELRLRTGCAVTFTVQGRQCSASALPGCPPKLAAIRLNALQIEEIFHTLCNGSVHTHERELAEGYLTTAVGNRVGVAGQFVQREGQCIALQKVTSLNLRIARSCVIPLPPALDKLLEQHFTGLLVVGEPGSGKTTLCNLIARFWDVQDGTVRIGGKNVRDYTADSVLEYISMVFQNVYLFHDSVENNIRFGRPEATHEQVVAAAKRACCHDFILTLPQGYDTVIGMEGKGVSQGQRQRILIARAIYKNPEYIFLDEATNSLDATNEAHIMDNLHCFYKGRTVVVSAHRLSTVKDADQIIVMDKGKIVERGNHQSLLEKRGRYYELVKNQMSVMA